MSEKDVQLELDTIRRMIESSLRDRAESGDIYIMWGVVVLLGTLIEALGIHLNWSYPWFGWPIFGTLGGIYSGVIGYRLSAKAAGFGFFLVGVVSLFLDRPLPQLLFAFMIVVGYIVPGVAMNRANSPDDLGSNPTPKQPPDHHE